MYHSRKVCTTQKKHHFCGSRGKCWSEWRAKRGEVKFKCDYCGKSKKRRKCKYIQGKGHFCSPQCNGLWRESISKGERVWYASTFLRRLETKLKLKPISKDIETRWNNLRSYLEKHASKFKLRKNGIPDGGWCETKVKGDHLSADQILFALQREIQGVGPLPILWHESKQAQIDWHLKKGTTATLFSSPVGFRLNRNGREVSGGKSW
jgi:hypothetical protein